MTEPVVFQPLVRLLDLDDSWVHLISAPVGSRFSRDLKNGAWSQVQ